MDMEMEPHFNSLGKRLRDEDTNSSSEWTGQPKPRKLAFRTSTLGQSSNIFVGETPNDPLHQHQPHGPGPTTPTLTPADSAERESTRLIRSPPLGPSVAVPSTVFTPAEDDMSMDTDEDGHVQVSYAHTNGDSHSSQHSRGPSSPMVSPKSQTPTRPGSRQGRLAPINLGTPNQNHDLSTRVPTPIYGHFSTHEQPTPPPGTAGLAGSPLPHHSRSNHYNLALYPHAMHERKMPSPISEDFAGNDGSTGDAMMLSSPRVTTDYQQAPSHLIGHGQPNENLLGHQQYLRQMQGWAGQQGIVDDEMAMSPVSPTTPAFGMSRSPSIGQRRRSDAISGSPAPGEGGAGTGTGTSTGGGPSMSRQDSSQGSEPAGAGAGAMDGANGLGITGHTGPVAAGGAKAVFSMGFKADCKMCRDRVPGHFSHITHTRA